MLRTTLAILLVAACAGSADRAYVPPVPSGSREVSVRPPVAGQPKGVPLTYASGIPDRRRDVIRDPAAWETTWRQIFAHAVPQPPVPDVDFAKEMVLLASMGTRPSGGFVILFDGAVEGADKTLIAEVTETIPGPGCAVLAVITSPVDALVVPRYDQVSFAERSETRKCH